MAALPCGVGGSAIGLSQPPAPTGKAEASDALRYAEGAKGFKQNFQEMSLWSCRRRSALAGRDQTQDSINLSFQIEGRSYGGTGVFDRHLGAAQSCLQGRKVILASCHNLARWCRIGRQF